MLLYLQCTKCQECRIIEHQKDFYLSSIRLFCIRNIVFPKVPGPKKLENESAVPTTHCSNGFFEKAKTEIYKCKDICEHMNMMTYDIKNKIVYAH